MQYFYLYLSLRRVKSCTSMVFSLWLMGSKISFMPSLVKLMTRLTPKGSLSLYRIWTPLTLPTKDWTVATAWLKCIPAKKGEFNADATISPKELWQKITALSDFQTGISQTWKGKTFQFRTKASVNLNLSVLCGYTTKPPNDLEKFRGRLVVASEFFDRFPIFKRRFQSNFRTNLPKMNSTTSLTSPCSGITSNSSILSSWLRIEWLTRF